MVMSVAFIRFIAGADTGSLRNQHAKMPCVSPSKAHGYEREHLDGDALVVREIVQLMIASMAGNVGSRNPAKARKEM